VTGTAALLPAFERVLALSIWKPGAPGEALIMSLKVASASQCAWLDGKAV
jgi:hypothetical protein